MGGLLAFLVRRVALGAAVVLTVAILTYGLIRVLRTSTSARLAFVTSLVADLALARLDPRIRASVARPAE